MDMSRPCREFRCPHLTKSPKQQGYCDEHAHKRSGWGRRVDEQDQLLSVAMAMHGVSCVKAY